MLGWACPSFTGKGHRPEIFNKCGQVCLPTDPPDPASTLGTRAGVSGHQGLPKADLLAVPFSLKIRPVDVPGSQAPPALFLQPLTLHAGPFPSWSGLRSAALTGCHLSCGAAAASCWLSWLQTRRARGRCAEEHGVTLVLEDSSRWASEAGPTSSGSFHFSFRAGAAAYQLCSGHAAQGPSRVLLQGMRILLGPTLRDPSGARGHSLSPGRSWHPGNTSKS